MSCGIIKRLMHFYSYLETRDDTVGCCNIFGTYRYVCPIQRDKRRSSHMDNRRKSCFLVNQMVHLGFVHCVAHICLSL